MTTRFRPAIFLVAAAIALSGCATGADDDLSPIVPGGDSADDLLLGDGADDEVSPRDAAPDTPECTKGVWLLDNESYRELMQQFADEGDSTVRSVTGQVVFTFGDGDTFTTLYDDWTIITDTEGGSATIERNGSDAGTVRYATGSLTLVEEQSGSTTTGWVDTPNGRTAIPNLGTSGDLLEENAGYGCSGDNLSLQIPDGTLFFVRM